MIKHIVYILLFLCSAFANLYAQESERELSVAERNALQGFNDTIDRMADDFVETSILVADQGYELFSVLGHMAIRMQCPHFGIDYVFSYEGERLEKRFLTFLKGDLKMGVFAIPTQEYVEEFVTRKKGLTEYKLNLTPEQKIRLWEILDHEMAFVTDVKYDLFTQGCAANARKWITKAILPDRINYQSPLCTHDKLIADIFIEQTEPDWAQFFIATIGGGVLVFGHKLSDIKKMVTPRDIVYEWQRATVNGQQLLSSQGERLAEYVPIKKTWFSPLIFSILILIIAFLNLWYKKPYIDWLLLTIYTILGCMIVFTQYLHPMSVIGWSWLVIAFNPLPTILWRWHDKWGVYYAAVTLIWCVAILAVPHILATNAHVILAVAFSLLWLKPILVKKTMEK